MLEKSALGQQSAFPKRYAPEVLWPIARSQSRAAWLGQQPLPFSGFDEWTCWELSWCDSSGMPQMASGTLMVPADSPRLCESKSLKLYLNSLNDERFVDAAAFVARVESDLSACTGAAATLRLHAADAGFAPCAPSVPQPERLRFAAGDVSLLASPEQARDCLRTDAQQICTQTLYTDAFRSVCPVTSQPDWAHVYVRYEGARIDADGLLQYLLAYRQHGALHEQCVEQIFVDILQQCRPQALCVQARFTRRGGIDINPCRTNRWADVGQSRLWRQ